MTSALLSSPRSFPLALRAWSTWQVCAGTLTKAAANRSMRLASSCADTDIRDGWIDGVSHLRDDSDGVALPPDETVPGLLQQLPVPRLAADAEHLGCRRAAIAPGRFKGCQRVKQVEDDGLLCLNDGGCGFHGISPDG